MMKAWGRRVFLVEGFRLNGQCCDCKLIIVITTALLFLIVIQSSNDSNDNGNNPEYAISTRIPVYTYLDYSIKR